MSQRITQNDLEQLVTIVNKRTGSPETPYTRTKKAFNANIGNYHLDYAYGGVKLVRMCTNGGGISEVSRQGFGTKRELWVWMHAFLEGLEAAKCTG